MILNIEVINVSATTKPTAKGSYIMLDVAFKRLDTGKIEGKKIMSFTNKAVFDTMSKATQGQQLAVTTEKNAESGYWDWTAVNSADASASPSSAAAPAKAGGFASPKSNYETTEERAARQVLIVRQSCLSNAVAVLKNDKKQADSKEVIDLAEYFSRWVFQKDVAFDKPLAPDFADMQDDIPL